MSTTKKAFEIPKIQEVIDYMTSKFKDWPDSFCIYYGNRFWQHYQSNGWLVSGKSAMKDWKAAVNGQWSTLKYREDIEKLNKCLEEMTRKVLYENRTVGEAVVVPEKEANLAYVDDILGQYIHRPTGIEPITLASCYDWLKENRLMKLSKEQIEAAKKAGIEDICKGKALAVQFIFDFMANNLLTFKQRLGV